MHVHDGENTRCGGPGVYALATCAGSQVFQASSAALTFFVAVSNVKGGTGGLMGSAICVQLPLDIAMGVICLR